MSLAGEIGPMGWARMRMGALGDLLSLDFSDPGATLSGGSFASLPNRGKLGGSFTQTSTARPTTGTQNGRVCAVTNGSQRLVWSLPAADAQWFHGSLSNYLVSFCVIPTTIGGTANIILSNYPGSGVGADVRILPTGAVRYQAASSSVVGAAGAAVVNVPIIGQVQKVGNAITIHIDNAAYAAGTMTFPTPGPSAYTFHTGYVTAGAYGLQGRYCEVRVTDGVVSSTNRAAIYASLAAKWIP